MAEPTSTTPPAEPVETPQGATPPAEVQGAATGDDEMISLKKSDYNNLISQRDRNHQSAAATEAVVMEMAQKNDINEFLSNPENKSKFPDVEVEDLLASESPEDFEKLAGQTQARIDKAAQRRLADIQKVEPPTATPEEKAERLKQLKANPSKGSFQEMLKLEGSK